MAQAATGDTVKVHYTGKLDDGTVFDTSAEREPLQFKIGEGQLIPDFERAVVGMEPGESKTFRVTSADAYGPYQKDMVIAVERTSLPAYLKPELNERLQIRKEDGTSFLVTVTEMTETSVTLDGNHPLAGKDLTFEIQLMEIA